MGKAEPYDSVNSFNKIKYIQEEMMKYQVLLDKFEEEDKMKILQVTLHGDGLFIIFNHAFVKISLRLITQLSSWILYLCSFQVLSFVISS